VNPFFPVGFGTLYAKSDITKIQPLPEGGPIIRITRESSTDRVFIRFGGNDLVESLSEANMMELVSGVTEELENPDPSRYDRYYLYSNAAPGPGVAVAITCSPTYERTL
jgi:hypothetical protein